MQNPTHDEKKLLRASLAARRDALSPEQRAEASTRICARLSGLASFRYAGTVLLYMPFRSEVDISPLIDAALASGKAVGLPRCEKKGRMSFYRIACREDLSPGAYGILEPPVGAPLMGEELLRSDTLAVIPGLAFDACGYRLGYGGGYYDRFLSAFGGVPVGVCFADLIENELPRGPYDRKVQLVITERKVILPRA